MATEVPHCEPPGHGAGPWDPAVCPPATRGGASSTAASSNASAWQGRPLFKDGHFRIFGSPDGVKWALLVNYTGVTGDRATFYKVRGTP
jgi:hypothetical protein